MYVSFSSRATNDLEDIFEYIAVSSPARAETFTNELIRRCELLVTMPEAFPFLKRFERSGVRRRVYSGYSIFYRITGPEIEVVRILHSSRDFEKLLGISDPET